jgi:hypothetical protein
MENQAKIDELKVNVSSVPITKGGIPEYIVVYDIIIPIKHFDGTEEVSEILNKVKNLILLDFLDCPVAYYIKLSFQIRHTRTGELLTWTEKDMSPVELSGLEIFDPDTFVPLSLAQIEDVDSHLAEFIEPKWVLNQIFSIVFHVQSQVKYNITTLSKLPCNGGKKVFFLPI